MNKAINRPKYTIPTIEEKLPLLTKAKVFTIVDVSEAFHTIVLDEKSSPLTTFQGPNGRLAITACRSVLLLVRRNTSCDSVNS